MRSIFNCVLHKWIGFEMAELIANDTLVTLESFDLVELEIGFDTTIKLPRKLHRIFQNFEPLSVKKFSQALKPGGVFVDIGANFGYYSAIASKLVASKGKVFAFEASPQTLDILRMNLANCQNVEIIPKAVSDTSGVIKFFHTPDFVNSGSVANPPFQEAAHVDEFNVAAVTIDEQLPEDCQVDFLKIDIQGDDIKALKGARKVIERSPNIQVLVEWAPTWMINAGFRMEELPELLIDLGLTELTVIDDWLKQEWEVDEFIDIWKHDTTGKRYCNLLASKRKI